MAQVSTAALLAGYVRAAGVRHIFGYPGESVIDFMEASRQQGLELVSAGPGSACPPSGPGRRQC